MSRFQTPGLRSDNTNLAAQSTDRASFVAAQLSEAFRHEGHWALRRDDTPEQKNHHMITPIEWVGFDGMVNAVICRSSQDKSAEFRNDCLSLSHSVRDRLISSGALRDDASCFPNMGIYDVTGDNAAAPRKEFVLCAAFRSEDFSLGRLMLVDKAERTAAALEKYLSLRGGAYELSHLGLGSEVRLKIASCLLRELGPEEFELREHELRKALPVSKVPFAAQLVEELEAGGVLNDKEAARLTIDSKRRSWADCGDELFRPVFLTFDTSALNDPEILSSFYEKHRRSAEYVATLNKMKEVVQEALSCFVLEKLDSDLGVKSRSSKTPAIGTPTAEAPTFLRPEPIISFEVPLALEAGTLRALNQQGIPCESVTTVDNGKCKISVLDAWNEEFQKLVLRSFSR